MWYFSAATELERRLPEIRCWQMSEFEAALQQPLLDLERGFLVLPITNYRGMRQGGVSSPLAWPHFRACTRLAK